MMGCLNRETFFLSISKLRGKKVKKSRYRLGMAQRITGR